MGQFSYDEYVKQQEARRQYAQNKQNGQSGDLPKTRFIGEWLKNDGDSVVVRFPYHSTDDFIFTSTHSVTFPNNKYPTRVMCDDKDCVLCKNKVKRDTRFFVKAIVYEINPKTNEVTLIPAIWDRPAGFAEIELKDAMDEYGDLSEQLFKLKRNGTGQNTRYTMTVIVNKTVYNPIDYKADFSIIENIDPARVLTRPMEKYLKAIAEEDGSATTEGEEAAVSTSSSGQTAVEEVEVEETPIPQPAPAPVEPPKPAPAPVRTKKDYSF